MNKQVMFQELGFREYKATWDYQERLFQQILDIKIKNRREGTAYTQLLPYGGASACLHAGKKR